jgi:hypothetical protein
MVSLNPRIAGFSSWATLPHNDRWAGYCSAGISRWDDNERPTITHPVLLDRIVTKDLGALFDVVDGLRMTEFKKFEVTVEHFPPAECTFGELVAGWVIRRPRKHSVSRIAVVIHPASLIALVLEFEPYRDVHGGRMSPNLDHLVSTINEEG